MEFIDTSIEDAKKICKLLNCKFDGSSIIDGFGLAILKKDNKKWNFYRKYLECESLSMMVDHLHPEPKPIIPDDVFFIKLRKHNPEIFRLRKEKLNNILNES